MSKDEEELVALIGKEAVEESVKIDMELYQWSRETAIKCARLRHGLDEIEIPEEADLI